MLYWIKLISDIINVGLGSVILFLGLRIFSSIRLSLQQSSVRLFLASAALFTLHEALSLIPIQTEDLRSSQEILETGFIGCLCLAMWFIVKSQKSEIVNLHQLADTDRLTELDNLTSFRRLAIQTIKREKESEHNGAGGSLPLAVAMMDIDEFKTYNDTFGHEAGNVALQSVARVVRQTARQSDLVARYGGEEFVSLLGINPQAAKLAAERIRAAVELECAPERNPLLHRQLTVSIGLATPCSQDTLPEELINDLIKVADHELYRAKRAGRNRVSTSEIDNGVALSAPVF